MGYRKKVASLWAQNPALAFSEVERKLKKDGRVRGAANMLEQVLFQVDLMVATDKEKAPGRIGCQALLGSQLKAARREARFTQERVAELLEVTQAFVSKVERGERRIDPVELSEFAALYEQEVDYFLLTPSIAPASPTTVELQEEDAAVLQRLAFERGESEEDLVRQALRAYARPNNK